jgi:hypothetical protein
MKVILTLSLALLMCVETAGAQVTYTASVSRHRHAPPLSAAEVNVILAKASKMLQKSSSHPPGNVSCNVTLKLKGPIGSFGSPDTPGKVDEGNIDAVHQVDSDVTTVDFHIQIVDEIEFCRFPPPAEYNGCSFDPKYRSMIVVHPKEHLNPSRQAGQRFFSKFPDHLLWAHEFGHLTGLPHRVAQNGQHPLMTPCNIVEYSNLSDAQVEVNKDECRCLLSAFGSNACILPPSVIHCPASP